MSNTELNDCLCCKNLRIYKIEGSNNVHYTCATRLFKTEPLKEEWLGRKMKCFEKRDIDRKNPMVLGCKYCDVRGNDDDDDPITDAINSLYGI